MTSMQVRRRCGAVTLGVAMAIVPGRAWPGAGGVAQETAVTRAEPAPPPDAFSRVCVRCHTTDRVVEGRRYRTQWEELVDQMVARGATGGDADFEAVLEYLSTEYGRVSINTAPAAEIAQVMHIDADAAERIVAYRKANGRIADFDALCAVPGVPIDALKMRRDALVF